MLPSSKRREAREVAAALGIACHEAEKVVVGRMVQEARDTPELAARVEQLARAHGDRIAALETAFAEREGGEA